MDFLNPKPMDVIKDGEPLQELDDEIREYSEAEEVIETGIAKRDPFDSEQLINLLKVYIVEIDVMVSKATDIKVSDDSSMEIASDMANQGKALVSVVSKKHAELKRPYLDVIQPLDDFKKKITDRVTLCIVKPLENKILPYMQKKEAERREKERLAAVEAARIQKELDDKAAAERQKASDDAKAAALAEGMDEREAALLAHNAALLVEDAPVVVAQVVEETTVKTETGTAKLQESWSFSIINFKEIPDDIYESRKDEITKAMTPIINAKIKAGMRNIAGIKIFKEVKISTRTSKSSFQF